MIASLRGVGKIVNPADNSGNFYSGISAYRLPVLGHQILRGPLRIKEDNPCRSDSPSDQGFQGKQGMVYRPESRPCGDKDFCAGSYGIYHQYFVRNRDEQSPCRLYDQGGGDAAFLLHNPADMVEISEEYRAKLVEAVAEFDDELLERFFDDPLPAAESV